MALPEPREGLSLGFSSRPSAFDEATIGDPEHYLWTSIRHWGVGEYADNALEDVHGVTNKRFRETIIKPTPHNSICGRTKAQRRGPVPCIHRSAWKGSSPEFAPNLLPRNRCRNARQTFFR
jgi:hypothetical protein